VQEIGGDIGSGTADWAGGGLVGDKVEHVLSYKI
jgi:hypothetical protein